MGRAGPTGEAPSALRRARPSGGEIDIGPAWRAGLAYINLGPTEKSVRNGHETAFWHGIGSKSGCVRSTDSRDLGFFWQTTHSHDEFRARTRFRGHFRAGFAHGGDGFGRDPLVRSGACPNAGRAWFGRVRARTSSLLNRDRQRPGRPAEQGPVGRCGGPRPLDGGSGCPIAGGMPPAAIQLPAVIRDCCRLPTAREAHHRFAIRRLEGATRTVSGADSARIRSSLTFCISRRIVFAEPSLTSV